MRATVLVSTRRGALGACRRATRLAVGCSAHPLHGASRCPVLVVLPHRLATTIPETPSAPAHAEQFPLDDDAKKKKTHELLMGPTVDAVSSPSAPAASATKKPSHVTPAQTALLALNEHGLTRGERPVERMLASAVLGGGYLAWGGAAYCLLGGALTEQLVVASLPKVLAALVFPVGLTAIVVTGTDLLTSNMLYASLPLISRDPRRSFPEKIQNLARLWTVSSVGNLAGSLIVAYGSALLFAGTPAGAFAAMLAAKKVAGTSAAIFAKAVAANTLVNLAILQAATASTSPGKAAMVWPPIATFVALGLEHSVANFYLLPLGMWCGADIALADIAHNLGPALAGNAVGAALVVGACHWQAAAPPLAVIEEEARLDKDTPASSSGK